MDVCQIGTKSLKQQFKPRAQYSVESRCYQWSKLTSISAKFLVDSLSQSAPISFMQKQSKNLTYLPQVLTQRTVCVSVLVLLCDNDACLHVQEW